MVLFSSLFRGRTSTESDQIISNFLVMVHEHYILMQLSSINHHQYILHTTQSFFFLEAVPVKADDK